MSDLHLEFGGMDVPEVIGDVLVLAGDIHVGTKAITWINDCAKVFKYVIYILGNHEYYDNDIKTLASDIKEYGQLLYEEQDNEHFELLADNVYFLDNDYVDLDGIRFIGSTMWSNISLLAASRMNDFRIISNGGIRFSQQNAVDRFEEALEFIQDSLSKDKTNVVVTHHCPNINCINLSRYRENDPIST